MESSFNRQHLTFSILFAVLITAATLPVIALHYVRTLSGSTMAALAIVGLLVSDCVMLFSTWWSVRGPAPLIRVTSMVVKYAVAVCAILTAACVLVTMRYETQLTESLSQATSARMAEIEARKTAAIELAKVGSRQAGREIARMDQSPEVKTAPSAPLPDWVMSFGVFVLLPLVSIAGAIALSISASIAMGSGDGLAEIAPIASPIVDGGNLPRFPKSSKKISGRRK
jgi:hypothetical protein